MGIQVVAIPRQKLGVLTAGAPLARGTIPGTRQDVGTWAGSCVPGREGAGRPPYRTGLAYALNALAFSGAGMQMDNYSSRRSMERQYRVGSGRGWWKRLPVAPGREERGGPAHPVRSSPGAACQEAQGV